MKTPLHRLSTRVASSGSWALVTIQYLQSLSQILKHLCDFPLPNVDLGLQSFQCSKIRSAQHWGRRGAHLSENKGVKSECKKFGENSRQMAPVSTICDEYYSIVKL